MNRSVLPTDERLLDLMAAQATGELSEVEAERLDRELRGLAGIDADGLQLAAAAAELSWVCSAGGGFEPMPESVKARVLESVVARAPATARVEIAPVHPSRWWRSPATGWIAAAAMLIVAVLVGRPEPVPTGVEPRESRARLMAQADDLLQVPWASPDVAPYETVRGDVVWSNRRQQGFLRLAGMPANDPDSYQYQLWIVDPDRDEEPVDGGVFDVPDGAAEVIVAIDAKLRIRAPTAFAITREKPGGVVVSEGPLLVVAPVQG